MKNAVIALMISVGFLGISSGTAEARQEPSLYDNLSRRASVKTYVAPFAAPEKTGDIQTDPAAFKTALEKALTERKSIKFEIVSDKSQADIVIEVAVTDLAWADQDPVDMLAGVGGVAMDAAMNEHYCRLVADVTVTDTKKNAVLWKESVLATVTTNDMQKETFGKFIYDDFSKVLIKKAFGKKKS